MAYIKAKDFLPGRPLILGLKAPGETAPSRIAGAEPQVKWTTTGGDSLYLDNEPAGDIERDMQALGIPYGEDFRLARVRTSHGGSRFVVERLQGDSGGHNVPSRSGAGRATNAPVTESQVGSNTNYSPNHNPAPAAPAPANRITPATACMCASMMSAVDAVMETQAYAARKGLGLTFSEESVRAIGLSIYISECKGGR